MLFRVTVCVPLLPNATLPKFTLTGLIVNCGGVCVAVPVRAIETCEVDALLAIVTAPVGLPVDVGVNVALNGAFWPAPITCPADNPLMLKPVPEALAVEIVTLAVPVLLSVIGTDMLLPTCTLPKLTAPVLGVRAPTAGS